MYGILKLAYQMFGTNILTDWYECTGTKPFPSQISNLWRRRAGISLPLPPPSDTLSASASATTTNFDPLSFCLSPAPDSGQSVDQLTMHDAVVISQNPVSHVLDMVFGAGPDARSPRSVY